MTTGMAGGSRGPAALRRWTEARNWSRHLGRRAVSHLAVGHAAALLAGRGLSMAGEPGLDEMLAAGGEIHLRPASFLADLELPLEALQDLTAEFESVRLDLQRRYEQLDGRLPFPLRFRVQDETAFCLYALVRTLAPEVVVETGVANGHSSLVLLAALAANGGGRLYSSDIDPRCGALVEDGTAWSRMVLSQADPAAELADRMHDIGTVDLFFHDADHRYLSQLFEYRIAWQHLRPGGVLLSDDVDDSRAFFDFAHDDAVRPRLLFDSTKVLGAIRRDGPLRAHQPRR